MPYNQKYFFEFDTLKTANKATKYYRVVFSKLEDIAYTYNLIELKAANSPFVLTYRSPEDNAFSPIKTSSAEINILYPYDPAAGTPEPSDFLSDINEISWLVQLYEVTSNGTVSTLKWQGFIIDNDIQHEWQDAYYYRMTATDNLAVLKEIKYSDSTEFKMPEYNPLAGVSVKDFVIELVNNTGNTLNYKFAWTLSNDGNDIILEDLWTSKYTAVDWSKGSPYDCNKILNDLLSALGCIIYQDNNDATWTVLNVPEIGTRTDNEVPYTEYDSAGSVVTTGVINLNSSINTGVTDLKWRDKNQLVRYNKPLGQVTFTHDYIPKNLLKNYSFQDDLLYTGWGTQGTFSASAVADAFGIMGITYDKNVVTITSTESAAGSVNITDYFFQNIDLSNTEVISVSGDSWSCFVEYESYQNYNGVSGGDQAYNFQVSINRSSPLNDAFYRLDDQASIDIGGQWSTFTESRIPVYANDGQETSKIQLYTRYTKLYNESDTISFRFLKKRMTTGTGSYAIDSLRFCITPIAYKLVNGMSFKAFSNLKYAQKEIKTIYSGGYNPSDWYVFEGALGLKEGTFNTLYCNSKWDRHYEPHTESSFNYLQAIVAKSILSFYKAAGRKFTGNIWGEEISYPKYFEIEGANNKQAVIDQTLLFQAEVTEDGGTFEDVYCGSNYLAEYYQVPGKFLMVEGTFDYQQSTTSVNLHEDLSQNFEYFIQAGFGGFTSKGGIFPSNYGSNSQGQAPVIEPS